MGDDNLLDQSDIDDLMQGFSDGGENGEDPPDSGNDSGGTPSAGEFEPVIKFIAEQAQTVIGTVLNKTVSINVKNIETATKESIVGTDNQFESNSLLLSIEFSDGLEGNVYFILSKPLTGVLADLMMMGDGNVEFEEDHKDALSELMNQIMGAVSTSLGTELSMSISVKPTELNEFDPEQFPSEVEKCVLGNLGLGIEGKDESEILIVLSPEFQSTIHGKFKSDAGVADVEAPELFEGPGPETSDSLELQNGDMKKAVYNPTGTPNIDMLLDIPLEVTIELGRSNLSIRKILELGPGSIIELDRKASEPVDLLVNDKVIAKGEVVVVDEYFGIRIISLISPEERIKHLR